ncbi:hypothetical protein FZEAL_4875 [Fusarium zealandicum]|uniref:Microbial-type PARG catalytic domain-containing protein n=1 Tax=Fusarium zealandicum TaxID=1053134 RepID=A0A8H4UKW2_9HYPO|nr:hypothetical protein FZEAL_4875 [Fusarium zealandicum]
MGSNTFNDQSDTLKVTAQETLDILPALLKQLGTSNAAHTSHISSLDTLHRLSPNLCPSYSQLATIRVVNDDTLNAAIRLSQKAETSDHGPQLTNPRVAVLNFANRHSPGGGWLSGCMAQEEALCYRTSLALSLSPKKYPLSGHEALYSPYALVIRYAMAHGHSPMAHDVPVSSLPVVSCITVAALRNPKIHTFKLRDNGSGRREKHVFAHDQDRIITKNKMRLALRIAAYNNHRLLVLGAFGCGIYANPPEDVAHCWLEVLREDEFSGGWWREIWFAVYDPDNKGNHDQYKPLSKTDDRYEQSKHSCLFVNPTHHPVEKYFNEDWLSSGTSAEVKAIYHVTEFSFAHSSIGKRFSDYLRSAGGKFRTLYHGTRRGCHIGEQDGPLQLCRNGECYLCNILRDSFKLDRTAPGAMFGKGIYTTDISSKADGYVMNHHLSSHLHAMLVEAVTFDRGGSVMYPETVVYREDAIVPVAVVMYTRTGWQY